MKIAIIYASKHGTTEKVANMLAKKLRRSGDSVELFNVRNKLFPDIEMFDKIIIGGSIYAGNIQRGIKNFCESNKDKLQKNPLGLYICCMQMDKAQEEFENAYCEELRTHSDANGIMGGEFIFEKMNFIERFMVKKIAKVKDSESSLNYDAIDSFVKDID